ncbi:MAG TPA: ABC transporter ATP-binding protein, partial [Betaproteobacteria bacterium]|nr:ABC transporter ATP-binding protein [Betaproteobacteria bacterium]
RIVEQGPSEAVRRRPKHPYTQALLAAAPRLDRAGERPVLALSGDSPSPLHPPGGCHFHPRCPQAMAICRTRYPDSARIDAGHSVCCHLYVA